MAVVVEVVAMGMVAAEVVRAHARVRVCAYVCVCVVEGEGEGEGGGVSCGGSWVTTRSHTGQLARCGRRRRVGAA